MPDPACYALVEQALGVAKEEVLFASSNGFDIAGAKLFGFRAVRIERVVGLTVPKNAHIGPDEFFSLMRDYAEHLGHTANWRISRLTDLVPLRAELAR